MYPTKEEILKKKPKFRKGVFIITKLWKTTAFKNWSKNEKWVQMERIELLIEALTALYRKPSPKIQLSNIYAYDPENKTILLDIKHPSIISALHELGHYLYGDSELKACQFSVWIFKECFQEQYEKLEWKGHMLIKK